MRIGARLVDHHHHHQARTSNGGMGSVAYIGKRTATRKRSCVSRTRMRVMARQRRTALQELFDACRKIFKGPGTVPPPDDVQRLSHILDSMIPEDVGLSAERQFFKTKNEIKEIPGVTCTTIYKCDNFSLCIFFLPPGGVIPLHNHPGMTVFSKLLIGSMHIKSYDWATGRATSSAPSSAPPHLRLATLKADRVLAAPCDSSVLYPTTGGNIHEFTALKPCAILDVLGPPYSKDDGRDCSFYRDYPYTAFPAYDEVAQEKEGLEECYGWLEEIDLPENSHIDGIEYLGPPINIEPVCH
ncbi:hypothetical protein SAY86_010858 [Trapa natans]|uniref:cysteine dioxygenase n=1 Tax=Trapa natans TaxID=22666 RepID=A0AAN7R3N9_TRANT|nr:hypothetical protein SAY86_010858 [Trapa natans]